MSVTTFISSLLPPISSSFNNTLAPLEPHYPIYHTRENSILPFMTDKFLSLLIPIVAYWVFSLLFHALDCLELPYFEKMRIHESEEIKSRNRVTVWQVIKAVLLQQIFQTALGWVWLESEQEILEREVWRDHTADMQNLAGVVGQGLHLLLGGKTASVVAQALGGGRLTAWVYWWGVPIAQMGFAFFIIDTWQYFLHRLFHTVPFLYRHFHSVHHALYVPYAFGALYNHPVEGLLLDSLGAVIAHSVSGMTIRQTILLFGISTVKTVDDHCGYKIWWDPCQAIFGNNAEYHDLHHQSWGIKKNFSQPFFTRWDDLLGTRMDKDHAVTMYSKRKASALAKKNAMLAVEEVETVQITPSAITTTSSITITTTTMTKPTILERKQSSSSETSSVSISNSDSMTPVEEIDSGVELDDPKSTIATARRATGMGTRLRSRA